MPPVTRELDLENGLHVILREARTAPIISTWIWYRVGSRNETEGHTGISHWVEHMMFKGSSQFPKGSIMRLVDRHGGYVNAMTSNDFTAYYASLPSAQGELALAIEADRMTTATFDPSEVDAERTVVIAEREGSENEPRYVLAEELTAAAFRVHPYHHQTIGWKADLEAIERDELYAHYQAYYAPNNAVLVVVGDFDSDAHLELIRRHFDGIPSRDLPPSRIRPEPPQQGERRVTVRMPGSAPSTRVAYHAPEAAHPDYIPFVVLNAVLSGGSAMFSFGDAQARSARLYRALVETQLASSVGSSLRPSKDPYLFSLGATVRDGRQPEEVEQALLAEVARLQVEPVLARELQVAIRQTEAQFAYSSESVNGQALTLGFLAMVDHAGRLDRVLDEVRAVTAEDVQRVARTYLHEDHRTVGWFLPTEEGGAEADSDAGADTAARKAFGPSYWAYQPQPRPDTISPETVLRRQLANGITVLAQQNPASASVTVEGDLNAGSAREGADEAGLAALTAMMLRRGSQRHSYQELNQQLDDVGASASFSASPEDGGFSGRALAGDLDLLLSLITEMLTEPAFAEEEYAKLQGQLLTQLGIMEMDTGYRANLALMEGLYSTEHPYGRPLYGTRQTLSRFDPDSLRRFYRSSYHPGTLIMSIVGALPASQMLDRVEATLGQWQVSGPATSWQLPQVGTPPGTHVERVHLPRKSQVDLIFGVVGMPRTSPDYYAAMTADLILGRLGLMGRLGESVRDRMGLAYYVDSTLQSGRGPEPWTIAAGVNPRDVDRAVDAILTEVARLRDEPVRDEELADARSYLMGSLPLRLETNRGIAHYLLSLEEYGLGLDYLQRFPDIIAGVTKEDIQRVVQQYLTLDRYVLAMAGTF